MNQSTQENLCKECGRPNVWALIDSRYRFMCGDCYNALEAQMVAFKNQHNSILDADSLTHLVRGLIKQNTP